MKNMIRRAAAFITAILDTRSQFASAGSLTANAAAETLLGAVMSMDTAGLNLGQSMTPVYLVIGIDTSVVAAGGAANITFKLKSDSVATLDSAPVTHLVTAAIAKGTLVAGYVVCCVALPQGEYGKYLGVTFTPDTNNVGTGKANAYLTLDPPQGWKAYANAI